MIKNAQDYNTYQDDGQKFTVIVDVNNTTDTRTIKSITGPGISGAVSKDDTDTFLQLMDYIFRDIGLS